MSTERLEEAEKRRLGHLQEKQEIFKKKNEKWTKKVEKIKLEEARGKKVREKKKVRQPRTSSSSIFRNLTQRVFGKTERKLKAGDCLENAQPELFGTSKMHNYGLSKLPAVALQDSQALSSNPCSKSEVQAIPAPVDTLDKDMEEELDTFEITAYEECDEDLKHRIGKTYPGWASDSKKLNTAIFSMILMPEYEKKLPTSFPTPDKKFKVFPNAK